MTQLLLSEFERNVDEDLAELTDTEREVFVAIERGDTGVREFARRTGRKPGTVGNLLKRARLRLDGREGEVSSTW